MLLVNRSRVAELRTDVAQVAAAHDECAPAPFAHEIRERGAELGVGYARAVVRKQGIQRVRQQRRDHGHIAEHRLHPWQLRLHSCIREEVEFVLEQPISQPRDEAVDRCRIRAHHAQRRLETVTAHDDAITEAREVAADDHDAVGLGATGDGLPRHRVAARRLAIGHAGHDEPGDGGFEFRILGLAQRSLEVGLGFSSILASHGRSADREMAGCGHSFEHLLFKPLGGRSPQKAGLIQPLDQLLKELDGGLRLFRDLLERPLALEEAQEREHLRGDDQHLLGHGDRVAQRHDLLPLLVAGEGLERADMRTLEVVRGG